LPKPASRGLFCAWRRTEEPDVQFAKLQQACHGRGWEASGARVGDQKNSPRAAG